MPCILPASHVRRRPIELLVSSESPYCFTNRPRPDCRTGRRMSDHPTLSQRQKLSVRRGTELFVVFDITNSRRTRTLASPISCVRDITRCQLWERTTAVRVPFMARRLTADSFKKVWDGCAQRHCGRIGQRAVTVEKAGRDAPPFRAGEGEELKAAGVSRRSRGVAPCQPLRLTADGEAEGGHCAPWLDSLSSSCSSRVAGRIFQGIDSTTCQLRYRFFCSV